MKALIDYDGAGTLVTNTKTLIANSIAAHNSDANAHSDTFVVQVSGKGLSTNDFTDEDKAKLDSLSTDTQTVDLSGVMRVYVGSVAPTDTSVIWFDTSAYKLILLE